MVCALGADLAAGMGAMLGVASVTAPGCAVGTSHFAATNVDAHVWKFQVAVGCSQPKLVFLGPWDPISGGCVPGEGVNGKFCLGAVPQALPSITTVTLCLQASCQTGSATVDRV
jgi:hypothetical protein